ncbi:MAG TPA: hypothetical protein VI583_11970 [Cyclobacteriaceae bacterium]|nr:hypothetical protein [Cyclobacteriaceae bacterium]
MNDLTGKAVAVKKRYEKQWLGISGVTAVGLGMINNKPGIIISIERDAEKMRALIPADVEGIPIEIRLSGNLSAL